VQSLSLPGRVSRCRRRRLARDLLLGGAARLARAGREDDARDDRLGDADVGVQPVLERRPHLAVDERHRLGVVQPVLGLPLELRFGDEHAEDGDEPLANVFGGEGYTLGREVVRLDEVAHRLAKTGAKAVLVRPARPGRDAVDVAADVFVGGLRPLERDVEPTPPSSPSRASVKGVSCTGVAVRSEDRLQVVGQPLGVLEDELLPRRFVLERDLDAAVQVARHLEPLLIDLGVELDLREDRRVGAEEHRRTAPPRRPDLLQGANGMALLEAHLPLGAVALHRRDQLLRQRVDDAGADAVEAAGRLVVAVLELTAGVQRGEDHLDRALLRLRMLVDRDPAPIVGDRDRRGVLVQVTTMLEA
jgi:hypothetical protein